jgi:uncharacterized protein
MNAFEHEETMQIASVLALTILVGSGCLWFRRWKYGGCPNPQNIPPWSTNWLDLGIVVWLSFVVFIAVMFGMERIIFHGSRMASPADPETGVTWAMIIYGMSIQLALMITLLGAKFSYHIQFFSGHTPVKAIHTPLLRGADMLIRYLPLLWLAAGVSSWVFEKLGIGSGEQETITMMIAIDDPWKFLVCILTAVIIAPVMEELFFRGILLRFLSGKMSEVMALILSAAFFSALHFNIDSLFPIFILGYLLGKIYRETGDIRSSMWMHGIFNALSVLLISLDKWGISGS